MIKDTGMIDSTTIDRMKEIIGTEKLHKISKIPGNYRVTIDGIEVFIKTSFKDEEREELYTYRDRIDYDVHTIKRKKKRRLYSWIFKDKDGVEFPLLAYRRRMKPTEYKYNSPLREVRHLLECFLAKPDPAGIDLKLKPKENQNPSGESMAKLLKKFGRK